MGTLELEQEVYDEERIRSHEAMMAEAGRTGYFTVALDASGEVVAYTQLAVPRYDPGRVFQWGTLVHPDHRGHRQEAVALVRHDPLEHHDRREEEEVGPRDREPGPDEGRPAALELGQHRARRERSAR